MEDDALALDQLGDLLDGLERPDLVAGKAHRYQDGLVADARPELPHVDAPVLVQGHAGHLEALLLQGLGYVVDGDVLHLRDDDVVSLAPVPKGVTDYRQVVGLGGAGGEYQLLWTGPDVVGDGGPGLLQGLGGVVTHRVQGAGVPEAVE